MQGVDKPLPYLFYRGIELHPRIFDVDVKQVNIFNFQNFLCIIKKIKGDLISEGQAFFTLVSKVPFSKKYAK